MNPQIQKIKVDPNGKCLVMVKGDIEPCDLRAFQVNVNDWLMLSDEPVRVFKVSDDLDVQVERAANGKEEQTQFSWRD